MRSMRGRTKPRMPRRRISITASCRSSAARTRFSATSSRKRFSDFDMNFEHSEDRKMLADSLGRFIQLQYPFEKRDAIAKSPAGYSADLWREFAELGIVGALFDPEHGGYGGAGDDLAVVFEALGRGLVVEPFLGNAVLAGGAIAELGNASQKEVIAQIIDGSRIAAFAHGEPESRYELARVATRAEQW